MLDKIPAVWRHLIIMLFAAILGWAAEALPSFNLDPRLASLLGVVIATLILWFTPLTRQYGPEKPKVDE